MKVKEQIPTKSQSVRMKQYSDSSISGMERLHKSMTSYIKSISKTKEAEEKDRSLPVAYLGATMISHGQQLDRNSVFGSCLIGESAPLPRLTLTKLMNFKKWVEQTNGSPVLKRITLPRQLRAGSSRWNDRLLR